MKSSISTNEGSFRSHRAYSPEEILAAGGTTAFSRKANKNNNQLVETLKAAPAAEAFTEEEWKDLSEQLDTDK